MDDLRLRAFGTRLSAELIDQVKMRALERRMSVQDSAAEAFQMWLAHEKKHSNT